MATNQRLVNAIEKLKNNGREIVVAKRHDSTSIGNPYADDIVTDHIYEKPCYAVFLPVVSDGLGFDAKTDRGNNTVEFQDVMFQLKTASEALATNLTDANIIIDSDGSIWHRVKGSTLRPANITYLYVMRVSR